MRKPITASHRVTRTDVPSLVTESDDVTSAMRATAKVADGGGESRISRAPRVLTPHCYGMAAVKVMSRLPPLPGRRCGLVRRAMRSAVCGMPGAGGGRRYEC